MSYSPQPDSLAHKVISHILANRDAKLTQGDVVAMFGVSRNSVSPCLVSAVNHGALSRIGEPGSAAYTAGPQIDLCKIDASSSPAQPIPAPSSNTTAILRWLAENKITVVSGVGMPTKRKPTISDAMADTIASMHPGDSFSVPANIWGSIRIACYAQAKRAGFKIEFRPCPVTEGNARVWRILE